MKTEIIGLQIFYTGKHSCHGWEYQTKELGRIQRDRLCSAHEWELLARENFPKANWYRAFEIDEQGNRQWVCASSI